MLNNRVGLIEPRRSRAGANPRGVYGEEKAVDDRAHAPAPKGGIGSHPHHNYPLSALNPRYFVSPPAMGAEFSLPERSRSWVSLNCSTDKSLFPRV
jgi:hypothetical protein